MIRTENYEINGVSFVRTWSDEGRYVVRDGVEYEEACDPAEFGRVYAEGRLIPNEEEINPDIDPEMLEKAEAYDILTGVSE